MASSVLLLLGLLYVAAAVSGESDVKIVGGQPVRITRVPWTAAIVLNSGQFRCGGTIVSERWVISAAHCFTSYKASDLNVRVGSSKHASGGQKHKVEQLIVHDEYYECQNDIAALKTETPMVFDESVARANLPTAGSPPPALGTKLLVSGWGQTEGYYISPYLMAVEVEVVDFSGCQKQEGLSPNETLQICAFTEGKDSAKGDSGGPMVDGNDLVGIVSCGDPNYGTLPAVYTNVVYYRGWINNNTGL